MENIDKVKGLLKKSALVAAGGAVIGASLGGASFDPVDNIFDDNNVVSDAPDQAEAEVSTVQDDQEVRTESSEMVEQLTQASSEGEVDRTLYSC